MSGNLPAYGLTLVVYRNSAGIANAMMVGLLGMALVLLVLSVLFFIYCGRRAMRCRSRWKS